MNQEQIRSSILEHIKKIDSERRYRYVIMVIDAEAEGVVTEIATNFRGTLLLAAANALVSKYKEQQGN